MLNESYKNCPFRNGQFCQLVKNILNSPKEDGCGMVDDEICKRCYETEDIPSENIINNVVASVLSKDVLKIIKLKGTEFMPLDRALKLYDYMDEIKQTCSCNFDINRNFLREDVPVRNV